MKSANVKSHRTYDEARTRLRLLLASVEESESIPQDEESDSLDFTDSGTPPADEAEQ
jgi:hypothetical protein